MFQITDINSESKRIIQDSINAPVTESRQKYKRLAVLGDGCAGCWLCQVFAVQGVGLQGGGWAGWWLGRAMTDMGHCLS